MAMSEFEIKRCEKLVGQYIESRRPPMDIRNELDLTFRIEKQSVLLIEIRPGWQNSDTKIETPIAKATYVMSKKIWKVYWMRADMKWHGYEPNAEVRSIEAFLKVVEDDEFGCFWG